jgi:hypothetical protein
MASTDFEANAYDIETTSVKLLRVGDVIQLIFSNKLDARLYYAEAASRLRGRRTSWEEVRDEGEQEEEARDPRARGRLL